MTIYRMVYTLGVTDPQEQFNKMIQYLEEGQHIYIQDIDPLTPDYEIPEVLPEDYKQALYDHFTQKNRKLLIDHWNGIEKWDYFYLKPEPPKPKFEYPPEFVDTESKEETEEEKKKSVLAVMFAPAEKPENPKKDRKAKKEAKRLAKKAKKEQKEEETPDQREVVPFPLPKEEKVPAPIEEVEYIPPSKSKQTKVTDEEPKEEIATIKKKGGRPKKAQPDEEPKEEPKKEREIDPQVLAFRERRKRIEETTRMVIEDQRKDEERERRRKLREQQQTIEE